MTARVHARTHAHRHAVEQAKRILDAALARAQKACLMWSGGKDSTALAHLVRVGLGIDLPVFSEKDDLDYPGERQYVERLGVAWNLDLRILAPPLSPAAWIAAHAHGLGASQDLHSRAAELSKLCFYEVVEAAGAPHDGVLLGLRAEESRGRALDQATHATVGEDGQRIPGLYRWKTGATAAKWRACPLAHWKGIDVYAYAEAHDIELLDVYRCIAFMHEREPWRVRKSWWLPGASSRHGGVAWLRHYYPSLYGRLSAWIPETQGLS